MSYKHDNGTYDLTQIFIGREQQLDLFNRYLLHWKELMRNSYPDISSTSAPSINNKIQGLVILLYGRGGFGKSTLLHRYHEQTSQREKQMTISKIIDWEFDIDGKRDIFTSSSEQKIDANAYFNMLCIRLASALKKHPDDFKNYQRAVNEVKNAHQQITNILEKLQRDDRFPGLRKVSIDVLIKWICGIDPTPLSKLLDNEIVKQGINDTMKIGEEQLKKFVLEKLTISSYNVPKNLHMEEAKDKIY